MGKRRGGGEVPIVDARLEHDLVESDAVLPSQWRAASAPDAKGRAVMRAVLERAVSDLRHAPGWSKPFRQAWWWFRTDRRDWLHAFGTICDVLGFDEGRLRESVVRRFAAKAADGEARLRAEGKPTAWKEDGDG